MANNPIISWLQARATEASTYTGVLTAAVGVFGLHLSTGTIQSIGALAALVIGSVLAGATTKQNIVPTVVSDVIAAVPVVEAVVSDLHTANSAVH